MGAGGVWRRVVVCAARRPVWVVRGLSVLFSYLIFLSPPFETLPFEAQRCARYAGGVCWRRGRTRGCARSRACGAVSNHARRLRLAPCERAILIAGATEGSSASRAAGPPRRHHHLGQGPFCLCGQCEGGIDHLARAPEQACQCHLVGRLRRRVSTVLQQFGSHHDCLPGRAACQLLRVRIRAPPSREVRERRARCRMRSGLGRRLARGPAHGRRGRLPFPCLPARLPTCS